MKRRRERGGKGAERLWIHADCLVSNADPWGRPRCTLPHFAVESPSLFLGSPPAWTSSAGSGGLRNSRHDKV